MPLLELLLWCVGMGCAAVVISGVLSYVFTEVAEFLLEDGE